MVGRTFEDAWLQSDQSFVQAFLESLVMTYISHVSLMSASLVVNYDVFV